MLKIIVLSEDSAFNTNLFLQSTNAFLKGDYRITVIYKASTPDYSLMYEVIRQEQKNEDVDFIKVDDFKKYILRDIEEKTDEDYICLCTSEDIFYRPFKIPDLKAIFSDEEVLALHMRLGENIKRNSTLGADNIFKPEAEIGNLHKYEWAVHYVDFGEPFSINGSIYRKSDIKKVLNKIPFNSREDLIDGFSMFGNFPKHKALCPKKSVLFTQKKDKNPKTAYLTKMLTNIQLMKGERHKPHSFDIAKTDEVEKDIGILKMLTGQKEAKIQ